MGTFIENTSNKSVALYNLTCVDILLMKWLKMFRFCDSSAYNGLEIITPKVKYSNFFDIGLTENQALFDISIIGLSTNEGKWQYILYHTCFES